VAIEVEFRSRLDQTAFDALEARLIAEGEDLGRDDKRIWFYTLPDQLLKVVHNQTAASGKIVLKQNRIGHGGAFPETEIPIDQTDVEAAVRVFNALGFEHHMHTADNQRHNYRYDGVEIAMKHSEAWGPHAEFEIELPDDASPDEIAAAEAQVRSVAETLGVSLMTEAELLEFTRQFEAQQEATKTP
jgi:adenylate cyclase class IV